MKTELTYRREGDYLLPNLVPPPAPQIGIWGLRRRDYLRKHHDGIYTGLYFVFSISLPVSRQGNDNSLHHRCRVSRCKSRFPLPARWSFWRNTLPIRASMYRRPSRRSRTARPFCFSAPPCRRSKRLEFVLLQHLVSLRGAAPGQRVIRGYLVCAEIRRCKNVHLSARIACALRYGLCHDLGVAGTAPIDYCNFAHVLLPFYALLLSATARRSRGVPMAPRVR